MNNEVNIWQIVNITPVRHLPPIATDTTGRRPPFRPRTAAFLTINGAGLSGRGDFP